MLTLGVVSEGRLAPELHTPNPTGSALSERLDAGVSSLLRHHSRVSGTHRGREDRSLPGEIDIDRDEFDRAIGSELADDVE